MDQAPPIVNVSRQKYLTFTGRNDSVLPVEWPSVETPVSRPGSKPAPQSAPKPAPQPAPQPVPQSAPKPSPQPAPQPAPQSARQPTLQPAPQSAPQPSPQPALPVTPDQPPSPGCPDVSAVTGLVEIPSNANRTDKVARRLKKTLKTSQLRSLEWTSASRRDKAIHSFLFPSSKKSRWRQRVAMGLMADHPLIEVYNVFKGDNISQLRLRNIERLEPGSWLHGDALDWAIFSMAGAVVTSNEKPPSMLVYATQFLRLMDIHGLSSKEIRQYHWNPVERQQNSGRSLFEYQEILIPVNVSDAHWLLARVRLQEGIVTVYDSSISSDGLDKAKRDNCEQIAQYVSSLEADEKDEDEDAVRGRWSVEFICGLPQQKNTADCGVFVCGYAEALLKEDDPFLVTQEYVTHLRLRLLVLSIELGLQS